jgi:hypothetical protein
VSSRRRQVTRQRSQGAIAQLVERVLCKHEVVGSIPSGSTSPQARAGHTTAADRNGGYLAIGRNKVFRLKAQLQLRREAEG